MNNNSPEQDSGLKSLRQIYDESWAFANNLDFRNPNNPSLIKDDLTINEVLNCIGFKEIQFQDLPESLQNGIKISRLKNLYGYPLDKRSGEQLKNRQIFINTEGNTIYFINKTHAGYSWSRIEKADDKYRIDAINHDSNIGEAINLISFFEIQNRQNPVLFPRYGGNDIPFSQEEEIVIAEESRAKLKDKVIGTA